MFQQQLHFLTLSWSYKLELDLKTKTFSFLQSLFKAITVFLLTTGLCSQNKNVRLQSSNFSEKEKKLSKRYQCVTDISLYIILSSVLASEFFEGIPRKCHVRRDGSGEEQLIKIPCLKSMLFKASIPQDEPRLVIEHPGPRHSWDPHHVTWTGPRVCHFFSHMA